VRFTIPNLLEALTGGILGLIMPGIILGGILSGIFTPTEAAAVSVAYAVFVGFFIFRTLKIKDIPAIFIRSAINTGTIFLILGAATVLSYVLAVERVPDTVATGLAHLTSNRYIFLLLVNLFLIVVGCLMEPSPAVILLAPILAPVAIGMGIDPLHFAMIMIINLVIGLITPPVGACLYVVSGIARIPLEPILKRLWPFLLALLVVLGIVTYVPFITLALPDIFGYH
jgi:tripartite ATP-independent transporter DctM subunit